jgi:hypothetical protein
MRDISDLLKQTPKVTKKLTDEELAQKQYLADLARIRDFTPDAERRLWIKPVGPQWKN